MKLTALSGLGVKGPACFLFEEAGRRIMLDLGRGPDGDALPDLTGVGPIDAVIFSHGHVDHTGGMGLLAQLGKPQLFASGPTMALSQDPVLQGATPYEGLTDILGIPFDCGLAGHAPGGHWLRLGGPEGLLYTGDWSEESTLYRCTLPPEARVMIMDAAYGSHDQPLPEQIAQLMALTDQPLLLPVPAGGRGLEMAQVFLQAGLPVALCPDHRRVAQAMLAFPSALTTGATATLTHLLDHCATLTPTFTAHGVMIGAGPNAERGVTQTLAPRFGESGEARVVFTGHIAEATPSEALVDQGAARFLRWNVHPTLTSMRRLCDAVKAAHVMAAFCPAPTLPVLAQALGRDLLTTKEFLW